MIEIGIRELKGRLSEFIARARAGETIIVTLHNRPVAQIVPLGPVDPVVDELRALAGKGVVEWSGGKPLGFPPGEGPKLRGSLSVADIVVQERDSR